MQIKGIDNGYLYIKSVCDLGKCIFKSAYTTSDKSVNGMATISIDGKIVNYKNI